MINYAEASHFDGYHFAHIAAREDALRLIRIQRQCGAAIRSAERRSGGRVRLALVQGGQA